MSVTGLPGQGPVRAGIPVADLCGRAVRRAGHHDRRCWNGRCRAKGQWVQSSLLGSMIAMMDFQAARFLMEGDVPQAGRQRPPDQHPDRGVPDRGRPHQHRRGWQRHLRPALQGILGFAGADRTPGLQHRAEARSATTVSALNERIAAVTRTATSAEWVEQASMRPMCRADRSTPWTRCSPIVQVKPSRHGAGGAAPRRSVARWNSSARPSSSAARRRSWRRRRRRWGNTTTRCWPSWDTGLIRLRRSGSGT